MAKKQRKPDELDTETTFADMNVEGFSWYDPHRKRDANKGRKRKVTRKEYRQLVRAAFAAYLPVFLIVVAVFGIVACIAYLWVS